MHFSRKSLPDVIGVLGMILIISFTTGCTQQKETLEVKLIHNKADQRVDVLVNGEPFTSYLYTDKIETLKKPVIYPIRTANGVPVTRGYPLDPRPGERVDHPHHIGFWLNYGDVNGLDFWNNSAAIPPERAHKMGTIRNREIKLIESGQGKGVLEVSMDWLKPDGTPILREETRFIFRAEPNLRIIDRITTLTAIHERVEFKDNKEGMIAVRVTRALEHPTRKPIRVTDANGVATDVPVMDNTGVTGRYLNNEGITGIDVWGKRSPWVTLNGIVDGDTVALAMFDHPKNVGYPTYWHARGYGLFAANPLGQKIFSKGKEELNFALDNGESTTFRYRLVIRSGKTTADQIRALYQKFIDEVN